MNPIHDFAALLLVKLPTEARSALPNAPVVQERKRRARRRAKIE
jgi:hypothetical protein